MLEIEKNQQNIEQRFYDFINVPKLDVSYFDEKLSDKLEVNIKAFVAKMEPDPLGFSVRVSGLFNSQMGAQNFPLLMDVRSKNNNYFRRVGDGRYGMNYYFLLAVVPNSDSSKSVMAYINASDDAAFFIKDIESTYAKESLEALLDSNRKINLNSIFNKVIDDKIARFSLADYRGKNLEINSYESEGDKLSFVYPLSECQNLVNLLNQDRGDKQHFESAQRLLNWMEAIGDKNTLSREIDTREARKNNTLSIQKI